MSSRPTDTVALVRTALLTALVTVVTRVIQIPMPATEGYINVGDSVIVVAGLLFGGTAGAIAGGVGSALADLLGGYSHWAPFTLVVKGLEGFLVGAGAALLRPDLRRLHGLVLAVGIAVVATSWMVGGYFLVEWHLYSLPPALASLPGNAVQAVASLVIGLPLAVGLRRRGVGSAQGESA